MFFLYDVDVLQYVSLSALKFSLPFFFFSSSSPLFISVSLSSCVSASICLCMCLSVCLSHFVLCLSLRIYFPLLFFLIISFYVYMFSFFMFCLSVWLSLNVCFCLPICQSVSICLYLKSGFKCVFYNSASYTHTLHTSPIITPCSMQIHIWRANIFNIVVYSFTG